MKKVTVIIPMYQYQPNRVEQMAFDNIYNTLSGYNITLIKPHSLDFRHLAKDYPLLGIESFDESYFHGYNGFNRLMLSDEFYERFSDSEYILIVKLDSYVFSNQLIAFCEKGYDYISAPSVENKSIKAGGCEGIALRKVKSHLSALKKYDGKRNLYLTERTEEHKFWLHEVPEFKLPDAEQMLTFAFGQSPESCYALNNSILPFACVGWHSRGVIVKFWEKYIG